MPENPKHLGAPMNDVREQLVDVLGEARHTAYDGTRMTYGQFVADAILERFEVTPKLVVTVVELGKMVGSIRMNDGPDWELIGNRMFDQLDSAGLTIVRREEGER